VTVRSNALDKTSASPEHQVRWRFLVCLPTTALVGILALVTAAPCRGTVRPGSTRVTAATSSDYPHTASPGALKQHQLEGESQEPSPASQAPPSPLDPVRKPLEVTCENGRLTIIAENRPLAEVMRALRTALGADIELPSAGNSEPIWVHLGPGPVHRVLRELLDATEFNYVIQASEEDENGVRSVLLTPRPRAGEAAGGPPGPQRAANSRIPSGTTNEMRESENPAAAESLPSADSLPTPPTRPMNQPSASANQQAATANLGAGTAEAGTPGSEQMIQQLQSMYQLRRQIQMQQNQKAQAPNQ